MTSNDTIIALCKQHPVVFVDIETNGLKTDTNILEVGCVSFAPGELLSSEEGTPYESLVYFDGEPNWGAFSVNKLDPEELRLSGRPLATVMKEYFDISQDAIVVGQNVIGFDLRILSYHALKCGYALQHRGVLDTQLLSRARLWLPSYSLSALSQHFAIESMPTHRALADVRATVSVFRHLIGMA